MSGDPFLDLDAFVRLPRPAGLWLSPDGRRLIVGVGTPDRENARYATALWEVDPAGARPARRLTRGVRGEAAAAFTPAGDLLFTSARPVPGDDEDDETPALWLLPAGGGDARVLAKLPGGVHGVAISATGTIVAGSALLAGSADPEADRAARGQRKEAGVSAILHDSYPVRYWDHDLGPDHTRLLAGTLDPAADPAEEAGLVLRDITGHVGRALTVEPEWDIAPDGRTVVTTWSVAERGGSERPTLVAVDVASGERRVLADDADHDYGSPLISPDGRQVAVSMRRRSSLDDPGDVRLALIPLAGGPARALTEGADRWPSAARWTPDGTALVFTADHQGRAPLWRVDAVSGEVTRLTGDDGAYSDIRVAPDGQWVYALRSTIDSPPAPVRVPATGRGGFEPLPGPAPAVQIPGTLTEVTATAADGSPLRAWLALPPGGEPAPLVVYIHGGPLGSWNMWHWRWNPWILTARGYAVLMPDPALSTGYGYDFVKRGWGDWGNAPYTDLMALTDAAEQRPDIDADRTAAMGGSFGGYMANWVAGHTDRFKAIVTHASIWAMDQMWSTTDAAFYWARELTPDRRHANSPHRFADDITTPMLVIHGDKDYRVPIGEGLRLWWDLASRQQADDGSGPHKFLYFPDENHWILKPGNARVWYATVVAFLNHHVLGEPWQRPDLT
ncbi:S9 family peptidase [Paractinoplanes ferrugineus]|uniref:Peptidase S9 n=1 Tax=Paractinoplanes ferrugineus TaxID=113564 RepID=A0A919MFD8_9ACTN|nr:alpha/beta fold hydrolase [Actinoplanes ferrugineus]GIE10470.1 peptidase S9 [Actinoplanes ferrugineus]